MKERTNRRVFRATNDRMLNATPSEGRVWQDSDKRCGKSTFFYIYHSYRFIPYSSACPTPIQENRGGRERPPKKAGGHVAPIAAFWDMPLSGPMGVALVLIDPCGKTRNCALTGVAERRETDL